MVGGQTVVWLDEYNSQLNNLTFVYGLCSYAMTLVYFTVSAIMANSSLSLMQSERWL